MEENATVFPMTDQMPSGTAMKPATAAKKLGIYLPAAPEEFQQGAVTHAELRELQDNPPEWLAELRRNGPHPRPEVARKLGITITALKNNGMDEPLTTEEIKALLADQPEWLRKARTSLAEERGPAADA
ncbi:hypothetical protein JKI95_02810 [Corynebacterium aquatimens]|uniref:DUF5997 family protein n=1 Tax=Corynebacterium TaxID=1716 RepID=UPI001F229EBC|nr:MULTISPECIES: DUF5997 family protein [Corynebacterium]QYH19997.1 hypothetical protein JKI95_02810 [Corynebacterium aquatimens]UIZ92813.1 hypothetical protein JZY91_03365 [Corynebacterium sp. CNCTC7651]